MLCVAPLLLSSAPPVRRTAAPQRRTADGGPSPFAAGLLLTDPLAEGVRPTLYIDAIVQADSLPQYYRLEAQLEARGFIRDTGSEVICRWRHRASDVVFDLMPTDASAGHI